ncbi:peptide/nickel transport system substrate-binding protein [Poseidonocella pacifica]|uniref:Peptide/nickel transport system substrate-binding protein n=1 Tax=Poseidonocella pacifica TaxID=871651 RepID=A0A1I0YDM8_9RHOB|nr:ABC transporter substrate-binding protein [Poseidonocella pacifica]SFB10886.1 peptide/nickel transport system substrate-binding protein [Poseidonocella pacifica]
MKRKSLAARVALPVVLSLGVALTAIAPAHAKEQLTVDLVNEPSSLDPHQQWNPDSYYVYRNIFDNMVTRDNDGQIVPQIATEWERLSDTEVVFTIRDDVTFHDGTPLTAEDVVYTVKRITDPEFGSPQLGQFNKIVNAEVTGDNQVTLTTDGAYPALMAQLVKLSIVPKHIASTMTSAEFNEAPVGSGPYVFENWDRGVSVTVIKNEEYWGDMGPFETVVFRGVPDAATRVADLQAGAADLVVTLNTDLAQQVESGGKGKVLTVNTERVAYFALNSALAPLDQPDLRKAIGYAIDREGIVEGLLGGYPQVVDQMLSPAHFGWAEGIEGFEYDPDKARELIAGLETAPEMEMGLATSPVFDQRVVQAIQQMLTDVGLNVAINTTDMATWLKDQQTSPEQAPMLTFSRWSCACQDPDGIMYPLLHSSSNWSRVTDTEIDALLDEARSELDEEKRADLYAQINRKAVENADILPLYQAAIIYGAADSLEWQPTSNESLFLNRMSWAE